MIIVMIILGDLRIEQRKFNKSMIKEQKVIILKW